MQQTMIPVTQFRFGLTIKTKLTIKAAKRRHVMYILNDGMTVTEEQIKPAFDHGNAVIRHGHGDNCTSTGLLLDGKHFDTRNECHSMWEEMWTRTPSTLKEALDAAYYNPNPNGQKERL